MPEKSVKVMISIPASLLGRVDQVAEERGLSRSAYVREALRHRLVHRPDLAKRQRAFDAIRRSLRDVEFDGSPEDMIRAERER